jgi:hypothetical protein
MGDFILLLLQGIFEAFVWAWEPKSSKVFWLGMLVMLVLFLVLALVLILIMKAKG